MSSNPNQDITTTNNDNNKRKHSQDQRPPNPAVFLTGLNKMEIEEFTLPPLGPHDVRVRMKAVGICASDVHYLRHGRIADFVVKEKMVIGHESAGEVVGVGSAAVTHLKVGDRVALEPGIACSRCQHCKQGAYNLCPEMKFFATPPVHGSLAHYVNHPADLCYLLPPSLSYEEGAMCEPLAVGIYACTKAKIGPGTRVLITGAGPIGLVTLLAARAFGASCIYISDIDGKRLEIAKKVDGGVITIDASGKTPGEVVAMLGGKVHVAMDCAGFPSTVETALEVTSNGGKVVLIGMGCTTRNMSVPLLPAAIREVDLLGSFRYRNCYETCVSMIASGRIDVQKLITHRIDLSAPGAFNAKTVTEGFAKSEEGGEVIKVMFHL